MTASQRKSGCAGDKKCVLLVGLTCLDIINTVDRFPVEDEDVRALGQRWQKGGNAANTAVILSRMLGCTCELLCSLNCSLEAERVKEELENSAVLIGNCPVKETSGFPTSCVFLNCKSGSRTIVHCRNNLPELSFEDFAQLDLNSYDWIHFEGRRNVNEIIQMIRKVREFNKDSRDCPIIVSVEIEKQRDELRQLFSFADVLFISKEFAQFSHFKSAEEAVQGFASQLTQAKCKIICAWGDSGACGMDFDGQLVSSAAFVPSKVVDTLGAGDTFNSGVVFSLRQGKSLKEAVEFGCKLAGRKCGMEGFGDL